MELNAAELDRQFGTKPDQRHKDLQQQFIKDCQLASYEPTQAEVEMYFKRNAFCEIRSGIPVNWLQKCLDVDGVEISQQERAEVNKRLNAWGKNKDIIGDPVKELATNLYISLWWRLNTLISDSQKPELAHLSTDLINKAKNTRNALLCGDSDSPLETTTPYIATSLSRLGEAKRTLLRLVGFTQHQKVKSSLSESGFGFGVVARKALEERYGDCLIAVIQSGRERARKTAIDAISKLNQFYGLPMYTDKSKVGNSINLAINVLEPIRNSILVALNRTLGPIPKK